MKYGPLVFLSAFFALSMSWFGFVLTPQVQLGRAGQETNSVVRGELYPVGRPGLARQGLEVYRANGCAYCHSQQVQQEGTLVDVVLADLANVGVRLPDANWHLKHLFAPQVVITNSPMPAYRFLFEVKKIGKESSPDALRDLPKELAPREGYEIVPKPEAKALAGYLLSL